MSLFLLSFSAGVLNNLRFTMAHVRPYRPSVRVGNWFEDVALEEDKLRVYLEKKQKGELVVQKVGGFITEQSKGVELTPAPDGFIRFGNTLCLLNPGAPDPCGNGGRKSSLISANFSFDPQSAKAKTPCEEEASDIEVTGSCVVEPSSRNAFVIERCSPCETDNTLRYGEKFLLRLAGTELYLCSDVTTFQKFSRKARHQKVYLSKGPSQLAEWKAQYINPQMRLEMEFQPVQANSLTVITHWRTNANLCVEESFSLRTLMGYEYEISCNSYYDTHKAEKECNLWVFFMPPFQNLENTRKEILGN